MKSKNFLADISSDLPEELVELLAEGQGPVRIERIVSRGHASPEGFWYDQDETEWVALVRGAAVLRFEDEENPITLQPGDWIEIAPHRRHRVEETSASEATVWLAVFWQGVA